MSTATMLFVGFIFLFTLGFCGVTCKASEAGRYVKSKEYDKAIKYMLYSIFDALLSAVGLFGALLILILEKLH